MQLQVVQVGCDVAGCSATAIVDAEHPAAGWTLGKRDYCPDHVEEGKKEWVPFKGPIHGTPGYQSLVTSKIVYQASVPTSPESHEGNSSVEAK
jgi:hypothetical protein